MKYFWNVPTKNANVELPIGDPSAVPPTEDDGDAKAQTVAGDANSNSESSNSNSGGERGQPRHKRFTGWRVQSD